MKAKRTVAVVLLATGVMAGGCGGADADVETQDALASRQDAIWTCDVGVSWHIEYYSDASLTQWVGAYDCNCDGRLTLFGYRTNYGVTTHHPSACY